MKQSKVQQNLQDFSIHKWYDKFKNICLESHLIEIPNNLLLLLKEDNSNINIEEECSQEFVNNLKSVLKSLNNNAFVKNNWHAPTDAKMFCIGNQLKVADISDLSLYLSVSNKLSEDFSNNLETQFYIVLKPWKNIHPATEFRCIVINNILRGITSRDWPSYHAHFKEEGLNIIYILSNFFDTNIKNKFHRNHFTFDVVMDYPNQPYIIDFGPIHNKTNLYAFNWDEIYPLLEKENVNEIAPVFRYFENDIGILSKPDLSTSMQ